METQRFCQVEHLAIWSLKFTYFISKIRVIISTISYQGKKALAKCIYSNLLIDTKSR